VHLKCKKRRPRVSGKLSKQPNRKTERQKDRKTERQKDRKTERQKGRTKEKNRQIHLSLSNLRELAEIVRDRLVKSTDRQIEGRNVKYLQRD
jgi:hypothetical protein